MFKSFVLLVLFGLLNLSVLSQPTDLAKVIDDSSSVDLIFAGDIMGHMPQHEAAWDTATQTYNYTPVFRWVKKYIQPAQLAIANLEIPLAGKPYSGYPMFSAPDAIALAARDAGFDVLLTANNHCADRSALGLGRTLTVLDSAGIKHTGTFRNQADRDSLYALFFEIRKMRIALLNYTYGTNGNTVVKPYMVNLLDTALMHNDILNVRNAGADYIIVTLHWGIEYQRFSNADQQKLAAFLFAAGANAIIGGHPHVVQEMAIYYPQVPDSSIKNVVVYSMGNYVSNQSKRYTDGGIMVSLHLTRRGSRIESDIKYLPVWVSRGDKYAIIPARDYLLKPEAFAGMKINVDLLRMFYNDTHEHLKDFAEIAPVWDNE
jgi:poly-gamma-glutamate capsule biosynthesis protein CapA/YwtB (metallophosphatase superfamily)